MNQKTKYITGIVLSVLVICALTIPAFALTELDVQSQVSASGKEGVAGNLFVWFLCAVAFLKISQKIDSFMQGLGINVGHTGGSMLAEVMLSARSIAAARGVAGRGRGGNAGRGGSTGGSGGDSNTFLQGGLAGVVNRSFYTGRLAAPLCEGSRAWIRHHSGLVCTSRVVRIQSLTDRKAVFETKNSMYHVSLETYPFVMELPEAMCA